MPPHPNDGSPNSEGPRSPVSDVWVPRSPRNATPFSHGRQPLFRGTGNPLTCEARIRNPFRRKNEVLPVVRRCASTCGRRIRTPSRDPGASCLPATSVWRPRTWLPSLRCSWCDGAFGVASWELTIISTSNRLARLKARVATNSEQVRLANRCVSQGSQ